MLPGSQFLWQFEWFRGFILWIVLTFPPSVGNWVAARTPLLLALKQFFWRNGNQPFEVVQALNDRLRMHQSQ